MATYELTIYTESGTEFERFEATGPNGVSINTSGEGTKITARSPKDTPMSGDEETFFQSFVPSDIPYTLETVGV